MGYRVAVVGATGNVGREILNILAERKFPVRRGDRARLRRARSAAKSPMATRSSRPRTSTTSTSRASISRIMSAGSAISKEWAPKIAAQGCIVIDNSSFWRYHSDVPLIVPEVNGHVLDRWLADPNRANIIANPNCSTAQLVVALKPLHDSRQDQARRRRDLPVGVRRRQGRRRRAVEPDQGHLRQRQPDGPAQVPQADRLQRHPPHRCLHGGRLHQGRVEDDGRDQEDPRSQDQGDLHLRARAGVCRPFRGGQHRVREPDLGRRGARHPARCAGRHGDRQARARWLRDPDRVRRRIRHLCVAASARTPPSRTGSRSGWSATTCARAPRSTPSRSPKR